MSEDARQAGLSERLHNDMTAAMKSRDELTRDTLRMALASVRNAEVSGSNQRRLTDDEVLAVLGKESKKRREAAEAFDAAGRTESADRERAEATVLARYLPAELSDEELSAVVRDALVDGGLSGPQQMGAAMKLVQPKVAGRAEGKRVAAEVRRQLSAG